MLLLTRPPDPDLCDVSWSMMKDHHLLERSRRFRNTTTDLHCTRLERRPEEKTDNNTHSNSGRLPEKSLRLCQVHQNSARCCCWLLALLCPFLPSFSFFSASSGMCHVCHVCHDMPITYRIISCVACASTPSCRIILDRSSPLDGVIRSSTAFSSKGDERTTKRVRSPRS